MSVILDRLVYCTRTFTHISVRVFFFFIFFFYLCISATRSTGDLRYFTAQSANIRKEALNFCLRDNLY